MFSPIAGGTSLVVGEGDLAVTVHLPPVGFVWNYDTMRLERSEIISRSSNPLEQYWVRPPKPKDYEKRVRREKEVQKTDPDYFDTELKNYRAQEWYRRLYGVWFMNNGVPTYLTGAYYFYLGHWTIDIGPPAYKRADLKKAYFWKYCEDDPLCYGMVEMTKRRVGKTYFGACMIYEFISRSANARAGIQSKTLQDAKGVFQEKLIQPWRKLIDFFRPDYDTSKGDVPKSELRFFKTSKKGSQVTDEYDEGAELESWIDFLSSETHAYDSQKLRRYFCDEVFKTDEVDILKRHNVVKPCFENESGEIIGKAIYTSTVEDMEGFFDLYIKLWEDSDMTKKNENGKTKSGLYRFFTPAQELMYVDKYGNPDEARALKQIENELAGMDDPREKSAYIRKNPRSWQEAFKSSADNCLFDTMKLDDRLSMLDFVLKSKDIVRRYNMVWDESADSELPKVRLVENRNGRFRFSLSFIEKFQGNDVIRRGSQFLPKNSVRFVVGIDPFDHNRTKDGRFSQGAAAVFMKFDPLDTENSDNFVAFYLGRPDSSGIFYEDMVKLCHFLSCQMLFEDQKPKIGDHFIDRGYGSFLVRDSKGHPGISASPKTHQLLAEHIETHITDNCHRVLFREMLEDWKKLDLSDTTAFDLAMATGYALIAAAQILRREGTLSKLRKTQPQSLIRKFKIKNRYGKGTGSSKFSQSLRKSSR